MDKGQMVNLWSLLMVLVLQFIGVAGHWWNKRRKKELTGSLLDYLFRDNLANSGATATPIFISAIGASMTGVAEIIDPRLMWSMISTTGTMPAVTLFGLWAAFQSGWSFDSMFNKGAKDEPTN